MTRRLLLLFCAGIVSIPPAAAGETLKITRYIADPVPVFDEQGAYAGEMPADALPKPPVPVVGQDGVYYGVRLDDGKQVWLRLATVEVSERKEVQQIVCAEVEKANPSDQTALVVRGLESACGEE